jgi:hypothetical protein
MRACGPTQVLLFTDTNETTKKGKVFFLEQMGEKKRQSYD